MTTLVWMLLIAFAGLVAWYLWERSHRRTAPMAGGLHEDIELPHEAEWELYHNALSLCSKKARVCLAELGIGYRGHHVDLIETGSYENIGRDYLAVNPAGLLPVLVHGGHPIYESHEIIRYAAEHSPASTDGSHPLIPTDPALEAEMQTWIDRASLTGDDPIARAGKSAGNAVPGLTVPLFAAMIEEIPYTRILEGLLFHRLKVRPLLFLAMKARGLAGLRSGPAAKIVARCARHMESHLDALETQLEKSGGPWILGDAFTLADVSWVVIFDRLLEADSIHCFLGDGARPLATAYWEALRARPSYRTGILEQGHETVTRGTERLRAAKRASPELRVALEPV